MSLLEWKKLAKQKTELGNKINFVHNTILKNQLGEKTSQESFQKAFKPITTKYEYEEYEEDEEIDYALDEEDSANMILGDLGLSNYDDIEKRLNQPEMTQQKIKLYVSKKLKDAEFKRHQLKGYKSQVSQAYNKGKIGEAQKTMDYKRIDNARAVLNQYIKHYENKVKMMKGSGLKKRGGNIVFFNNVKQLLKKLELIVGEILAGNTSIEMRNTGVAILDMLLKTSKINKAQHEKLYKTYFKI